MTARNRHIGSSLDNFLAEEGLLEEVSAVASKRVVAWQIGEAMKSRGLGKKAMAERMGTGRSHLDRLLDVNDTGLTLETLTKAANAFGRQLRIEPAA